MIHDYQIREKERQLDRYEMRNNSLCGLAIVSGPAAIVGAGLAAVGLNMNVNDFLVGGLGILAFINGYFVCRGIREIIENSREMGKLEGGIEELMTRQAYPAVVPSE